MYSEIAKNKRKSIYIMLFFLAFVAGLIYLFSYLFAGKSSGVFYGGLIGSTIYVIVAYYSGSKMALAMNRAKEIQKKDNPRLYRIVENLAITEGLPAPKVYIMNDPAPNAFATGRDPRSSVVCVTTGLLELMNDKELEGVVAHELGHIKNYDIRVTMIAFALTVVISFIADMILRFTIFSDRENNSPATLLLGIFAAILAPIVATFIQLAISRRREYLADATGALATRYPEGLASALEKIGKAGSATKVQNSSTAHLFFANPLKKGSISSLFSTHPPIKDRVARLRSMGTHA
ncbi:MAG: M48 family metalloprotease [bacterium]